MPAHVPTDSLDLDCSAAIETLFADEATAVANRALAEELILAVTSTTLATITAGAAAITAVCDHLANEAQRGEVEQPAAPEGRFADVFGSIEEG